jgi:hypothetical protein
MKAIKNKLIEIQKEMSSKAVSYTLRGEFNYKIWKEMEPAFNALASTEYTEKLNAATTFEEIQTIADQ